MSCLGGAPNYNCGCSLVVHFCLPNSVQWCYINNYSERRSDGRVYAKVDGAFHLIGNILFNDEKEHMFKIQAHMCTKAEGDVAPSDAEDWIKSKYLEDTQHSLPSRVTMDLLKSRERA